VAAVAALVAGCAFAVGYRAAKGATRGPVHHFMIFVLKAGAMTPEDTKTVEEAFLALPSKVPSVEGCEWGANIGPWPDSGRSTHCFLLSFRDAKAHDEFLAHPAHKEFRDLLEPYVNYHSHPFDVVYVPQE